MSDGVEWAIHCCTVLAVLPPDDTLPAARLAEYHEVPPAYLAKHLAATTAAGITTSTPGPRGGYRLARPPAEISVLEVVEAVEGRGPAFRCAEIRQRGPGFVEGAESYRRTCGIARTMWRAEAAWRSELAATTIADLVAEIVQTVSPEQVARSAEWFQSVQIRRRRDP
jgi:Rrf2 family protein